VCVDVDGLFILLDALSKNESLVSLTLECFHGYPLEVAQSFIDLLTNGKTSLQMLKIRVPPEFVHLIEKNAEIKLVELNGETCPRILENRKQFKQEARLAVIRRMSILDGVEKNAFWLIFEMSAL
jgi:hypothetical protein